MEGSAVLLRPLLSPYLRVPEGTTHSEGTTQLPEGMTHSEGSTQLPEGTTHSEGSTTVCSHGPSTVAGPKCRLPSYEARDWMSGGTGLEAPAKRVDQGGTQKIDITWDSHSWY